MYKEHFGLKEMPFSIAPDPRYLYMSDGHREALAHLEYGLHGEGGFVLLTGEVGTGKTTVCRRMLEYDGDDLEIAFVLNPVVTVEELLATFCDELGIKYPGGNTSVKVFVDNINEFLIATHAKGRRTVLIIEEAQNLRFDVLEQLRLLTNLETSERKLLQIIMVGQPELREILSKPELRQLAQRITARYHLGPLTRNEVVGYVSHRLAVAGGPGSLFPHSLIRKIFRHTGGIPRLINVLCDRALLGAYVKGKNGADSETLREAAKEVFPRERRWPQFSAGYERLLAGLTAIAVMTVLSAVYYYTRISQRPADTKNSIERGYLGRQGPERPRLDTLWWFDNRSPFWGNPEGRVPALNDEDKWEIRRQFGGHSSSGEQDTHQINNAQAADQPAAAAADDKGD